MAEHLVSCKCGCSGIKHIKALFGGRVAPTGIALHVGTHNFFKLNSLEARRPLAGHDCSDEELMATFACYDQNESVSSPQLPRPRPLLLVSFSTDALVQKGADALQKEAIGQDDVGVCFPASAPAHVHGTAVRYGDRAVVATPIAKGEDAPWKLLWIRVVGTVPAVGLVVAKVEGQHEDMGLSDGELIVASESNLMLLRLGVHWTTPAQVEAAQAAWLKFEAGLKLPKMRLFLDCTPLSPECTKSV